MATADELVGFVRDSLARGLSRPEIAAALLEAGWSGEQTQRALSAFAVTAFPVPVPRPRPSLSARETFLYLLLFISLYLVAFNLGNLIFKFIELGFPDPATGPRYNAESSLRWTISYLIVTLPLFLFLARLTGREAIQDPNRRVSPIRRWLTYLTLFVAACVLVGDVIGLVNGFLSGELTARFALKVLTVALIAGIAFWYYLTDLRADEMAVRSA
jgi:hypothetical protein